MIVGTAAAPTASSPPGAQARSSLAIDERRAVVRPRPAAGDGGPPRTATSSLAGGALLAPASVLVLQQADETGGGKDAQQSPGAPGAANRGVRLPGQLTKEEQAQVAALKARDREVRAHEGAHRAAGGELTGPPSFEFETGPDGRQYAVGGEVSIDRSPEPGDPEATIAKLERVIRAALAPAEPSPQDRAVAAQAQADLLQARAEAARQSREEKAGTG